MIHDINVSMRVPMDIFFICPVCEENVQVFAVVEVPQAQIVPDDNGKLLADLRTEIVSAEFDHACDTSPYIGRNPAQINYRSIRRRVPRYRADQ